MTDRLASGLRRWSTFIVVAGIGATIALALALGRLELANDRETFALPAEDPVMLALAQLERQFGQPTQAAVILEYGRSVQPDDVARAAELARELATLEGIAGFVPPVASADSTRLLTVLLVEPAPPGADLQQWERAAIVRVRDRVALEEDRVPGQHIAALPLVDLAFEEHLAADLGRFGLLSAVLSLGILWLLFRAIVPVFVVSGVSLMAVIWGLAGPAITRTPISMGLSMMVPILLVLSVAYAVHYLAYLFRPEQRALSHDDAVTRTIRAVFPPSLLAGLTTAAGFFTLNASALSGIREVGTYLGLGVLGTVVLTSVFLPALLFRFPGIVPARGTSGAFALRAGERLGGFVARRGRAILLASAAVAAIAAAGTLRVRVGTDYIEYLDRQAPVRHAYHLIDEHFGGAGSLSVLATVPPREESAAAARLDTLAAELRAVEAVGFVTATMRAASPDSVTLRADIAARLLDGRDVRALVDDLRARVDARIGTAGVQFTGPTMLLVRTQEYIVRTQVASFAIAFGVILLLIAALTRELRLSAEVMMANAAIILLLLGAMGWLGIPLDLTTVMIASVVLGLAVDDTIHFVHRFRAERGRGTEAADAVRETYRLVGPALVTSTLVLLAGFLVLTASSFVPMRYFGLLAGFSVLAALAGDLIVLPALLTLRRARTR